MEPMSDNEINRLVDNEREWRKFIIREMRDIRKEQNKTSEVVNTLKTRVYTVSGLLASVVGFFAGRF